jgi:hypothetical protein
MEGMIKIGAIQNQWSWEYDSSVITATLFLDPNGGGLFLDVNKVHTKTGIGSGSFRTHLGTHMVGTLKSPMKGQINSILKELKQTVPFQRMGWYTENERGLSLKQLLLNTLQNHNEILRAFKLKQIQKKIQKNG